MSDNPQAPDFTNKDAASSPDAASNPVYTSVPPGVQATGGDAPSAGPAQSTAASPHPHTVPVEQPPSSAVIDQLGNAVDTDSNLASNQVRLRSGSIVTIKETNGLDDHRIEDLLTEAGYTLQGVGAAGYTRMMALCAIEETDGGRVQIPKDRAELNKREGDYKTSEIKAINDLYTAVNLTYNAQDIHSDEGYCVTPLGKRIVVMETTGWHDHLVEDSLTAAGYNMQGTGAAGYTRMMALCAIESVDNKPMVRPRTKTDIQEREKMFLSKEIQMIIKLYQEVNLLGGTF